MSGKITLAMAISLDGFIADEAGGYDWITGQGDNALDTENERPFAGFLDSIDIVVMGSNSYKQGFARDYKDKQIYVASRERQEDTDNIRFIQGDIAEPIRKERDRGKNIYLFGGGLSADAFIKADLVDEYRIGIVPILLGRGIPLFLTGNPVIPLHLDAYSIRDGIPELHYSRRPKERPMAENKPMYIY